MPSSSCAVVNRRSGRPSSNLGTLWIDTRPSIPPVPYPKSSRPSIFRAEESVTCLMSRRVFVTVGSTKFPELVRAVLTSEATTVLSDLGFGELCVQYGTDKQLFLDNTKEQSKAISVTGFDYSPSIDQEMEKADLIISHAGSTSCFRDADQQGRALCWRLYIWERCLS